LTEEPGFRKVKVHGKAPNAWSAIPAAGLAGISCRRDAAWLGEGPTKLLPVGYFHIVVTIPAAIVDIAYQNKAMITDMLRTLAAIIATDPLSVEHAPTGNPHRAAQESPNTESQCCRALTAHPIQLSLQMSLVLPLFFAVA
jgi:hypothetical protein